MPTFCDKCGAELKDSNLKFCHNCGAEISTNQNTVSTETINAGISCPHCGTIVPFGQTICEHCGQPLEDNKTAIIIGYVVAFLIGIFGLIPGIYLLTRNNAKSKTQGLVIIALSIIPGLCNLIFGNLWIFIISYIVIIGIGLYLWKENKILMQ